ncbi:MAG: extracellular solute-binding protein [Caldilineaceae bacterium]
MVNERISRRSFLALTASFAGAVTVAACAAPAAAPSGQAAGGDAAPAAATADLRLTFWGDLADMPTWNWGLEEFKKEHGDINIQWENTPWGGIGPELQTEGGRWHHADVVGMVSMYSQQYIRQGTLLPLDQYVEREPDVNIEDFGPRSCRPINGKARPLPFYDLLHHGTDV